MLTQTETPIINAVEQYIRGHFCRFHMPGHQGIVNPLLFELLGDKLFQADLTEVPGLDDLHMPVGVIAAAEKLAAELFGAEKTIFLVNGSTQGVLALMLQQQGQKIILPRYAHQSLYNGLILSQAKPVYVQPKYLVDWDIVQGVDEVDYLNKVELNQDAAQVWLTSPTYFGHIENITFLKKAMPSKAKLYIDEAHGAHCRFLGMADAMSQGADAAVQSWHKTLGALTQGAVIHFKDGEVAANTRAAVSLTESTSPSYLLLMSLDAARKNMAMQGKELLEATLAKTLKLRKALGDIDYIKLMPNVDPTKIVLSVDGLTGYQFAEQLIEQGIMPEMSGLKYVLLQTVLNLSSVAVDKLLIALTHVKPVKKELECLLGWLPSIPEQAMLPGTAYYLPKKSVPLKASKGMVSGEFVVPYPPGIPLLVPGEVITQEIIDYLIYIQKAGAKFHGPKDQELLTLAVI